MSSRSRSLLVFSSLIAVTTLVGFLAGRMSVSNPQPPIPVTAPEPIQTDVKPIPPAVDVAVVESEPAREPEPATEPIEVGTAALATSKTSMPVEKNQPEVVRASPTEVPRPVVIPPMDRPGTAPSESDKPRPDEVLTAKGLSRSGQVYVLAAEDELRTQGLQGIRQASAEWERIVARMEQLTIAAARQLKVLQAWEYECRQGYQTMAALQARQVERKRLRDQATADSPQKGTPNALGDKSSNLEDLNDQRQWQILQSRNVSLEYQAAELQFQLIQAQREYDQLGSMALAKEGEIQRRQGALVVATESVQKRYDDLANDRQVIAALEDLNRGTDLKFALGPVENYRSNIAKMRSDLLKSKDLHASNKGKRLVVGLDQDINSLAFQTSTFEDRLGNALGKQKDQQRDEESRPKRAEELAATIEKLEEQVAKATQATRKAQLTAQLAGAKTELANLRKDEQEVAEVRKKLAENVATNRDGFVQNALALRKAVDDSQEKHDQLENDPAVKKAKARMKAIVVPLPKGAVDILKRAEKLIQTVELPLVADKTAIQVDAIINGQSQTMVVDPAIEVVRLSRASALALEIELSEASPEFDLLMEDGQTLRAKRTTIKSVELGPLKIPNVECVVVLEAYDAPPVLGTHFLNQFSYKLDPAAETLTLTQVNMIPKSKSSGRSRSSR
ncbi:gag-polyprotein putative aspartyl protease [Singulisphaera sp. GP187]|uniref:retroviral-like aspartic protease family protein n=1 Tax=Singulisphaera sp. GP187 TaxID=1882752 RepID=UPI000927FED4|nr:retroviral-like aspartic protease family protein [Singulisphaera sp. GP187]SIO60258.1 gag-polyprotein putative aspartyl protease [Singulisphaera sp. GP187]